MLGKEQESITFFNNEIHFNSDITQDSVNKLIGIFPKILKETFNDTTNNNSIKYIYLYVNSPGGSLYNCYRLIDYIEIIKVNHNIHLITICTGFTASAATLLCLIGDSRYITENASCLIHEMSNEIEGNYTNLKNEMKHNDWYNEIMIKIYLNNNKKLLKNDITNFMKNETYFNSTEYVDSGFAQSIFLPKHRDKVINKTTYSLTRYFF